MHTQNNIPSEFLTLPGTHVLRPHRTNPFLLVYRRGFSGVQLAAACVTSAILAAVWTSLWF